MKNNNKTNKIIIVLIIIVFCSLLAYIAKVNIDKNLGKEQVEEVANDKERTVTVFEPTDIMITSIMNTLTANNNLSIETYAKDKDITPKRLKTNEVYEIVRSKNNHNTISLDEFNKITKKVFGKNYKFNPKKINKDDCLIYNYDSKKQEFTKNNEECNIDKESAYFSIISAKDVDKELEILIKVVFKKENNYYKDYQREELLADTNTDLNSLYEQATTYTLTFKKEKNHYMFVKSTGPKVLKLGK